MEMWFRTREGGHDLIVFRGKTIDGIDPINQGEGWFTLDPINGGMRIS